MEQRIIISKHGNGRTAATIHATVTRAPAARWRRQRRGMKAFGPVLKRSEALDGKTVDWMEKVSDAQFNG